MSKDSGRQTPGSGLVRADLRGMRIHFMGAGGIGMSAVALAAIGRGAVVSGCDLVERGTLKPLRTAGARIYIGHNPRHVRDKDMLVYTNAVPRNHPELAEAARRNVRVVSREHFLALLMQGATSIGITGAHGKTTTTWLVARILLEAGLDPTVVVGGLVDEIGGNFRSGAGGYFVSEVDESNGIIADFNARVVVATNTDDEHLDRFAGRAEMAAAIAHFIERCGPAGTAVLWVEDAELRRLAEAPPGGVRVLSVGLGAACAYRLTFDAAGGTLHAPGGLEIPLRLRLPGRHNVTNAALAATCGLALGIEPLAIGRALSNAPPVKRRQNLVASVNGVDVYDDYAHHPTEIEATQAALRPCVSGRMLAIFQPHRYTRTAGLAERFRQALSLFDEVVLLDIYAAGEQPLAGVSAAALVEQLVAAGRAAQYVPSRPLAVEYVVGIARAGDCVLTLGAGDVGELAHEIARLLAGLDKA